MLTNTRAEQRREAKETVREVRYDRRIPSGVNQTARAFNSGNVRYAGLRFKASKYRPHIGDKERARHAGKPDGLMHVTRFPA